MTHILGVDLSVFQGDVDFLRVPAEYAFIIERVSIGEVGLDTKRERNRDGAISTGRLWGAYDFFLPNYDVQKQFDLFKRAIGDQMPNLPLAIDLEATTKAGLLTATPQAILDATCRLADLIESVFGRPPLVYSYPNYLRQLGASLAACTALLRCPLWLADYGHGENPPDGTVFAKVPLWDKPTLVQVSGDKSSRVPGIVGAVDHNVFLGTLQELREGLCGLPPKRDPEPMPIVHPPVEFEPRVYDSDPTLRVVAPSPPVEIVDDTPPDEVA